MKYGTIVDVKSGAHGLGFRGRFIEKRGDQVTVAWGKHGARYVSAAAITVVSEQELERVRAVNRESEMRCAENERQRRASLQRIFSQYD